jgi:hypothetical protein
MALYVCTLARDVLPADAGELQLVAAEWGVAHPTGFPLYTILANFFTRIPVGPSPAFRANLLSAIASTATLLLLYLSVYRLTRSRVAGLLAAVALGTSTTFWSQATTANVRSLTALFTAALTYMLLVMRGRQLQLTSGASSLTLTETADNETRNREPLWFQALFVLTLVLAITHHTSLVFIGALFIVFAIIAQPSIIKEPGRWPILLLAGLLALLPLLYLPIRGAFGAVGAPEDLNTFNGFMSHVLGLGFRGDLLFFDDMSVFWARLGVMANVFTFQFAPLILLFALLGLILLILADRLLGTVLAAAIAVHTIVAAVYRAPQTVEYMLPVYVLLAVLVGYATGGLLQFQSLRSMRQLRFRMLTIVSILLVTALTVAVLSQAVWHYRSYRQLGRDLTARDYALPLLQGAPPDTVILADWHWATPLWYLQAVEGLRPDVEVEFVYPESGPYGDTWAKRIASSLSASRPVLATHFDPVAYRDLPLPEPFHRAFLFRQTPLLDPPDEYTVTSIELGPSTLVEAYHLESTEVLPGEELVLSLIWQPTAAQAAGDKLYAHLIGPDGRLYAGDDQSVLAQQRGLSVNEFRLTPLLQTRPGRYDLVIGNYNESTPGNIASAKLADIEVRADATPPITGNRVYRPLAGSPDERTLIGYDWDSTLPDQRRLYLHWSTENGYETMTMDLDGEVYPFESWSGPWGIEIDQSSIDYQSGAYVPFGEGLIWLGQSHDARQAFWPGNRVKLTQEFTTAKPILSDLVVSLRLVGYQEDGQSWDWWDLDDGVPAMGAIPTLKWIAGSRVRHSVWSTISPDAWPQQETEPLLLLYDAFTSRQLPILDERIAQRWPWIPLGRVAVTAEQ